MVRVRCVFIQEFYELIGSPYCEAELPEGATVRDLIDYIDSRVKRGFREAVLEEGRLRWPVEVAVDGRRIDFLDGLDTKLRDGARVLFSPRALFVV